MSIVALNKVTLVGRLVDRDAILAGLQRFGRLHLIPKEGSGIDEQPLSPRSRRVHQAIQFLEKSQASRRPLKKLVSFHLDKVVGEALALQARLRELEDVRDDLQKRLVLMRPWGNFRFPPDELVEHIRLWFYRLPVNRQKALEAVTLPWQIVGRGSRFMYLVVICPDEPPADLLPVPREHLGSRSLEQLQDDLESIEQQLDECYAQRQELTRYRLLLRRHKAKADNRSHLRYAMAQTEEQESLFTLSAWVAEADLEALSELAVSIGFALQACEPAKADRPPTWLQPAPGFGAGGALARFYQLPAYGSWDPSVHLFLSFVLFFSMILSDAGYALILMIPLLLGWKQLGRSDSGRDNRRLLASLIGGALVWGILAGSYFGFAPKADSIWQQLAVVDVRQYNNMMLLSVLVGVGHLLLANISLAWCHRHDPALVLARVGWMLLVLAGVGLWKGTGEMATVSVYGVVSGILLILGGNLKPVGKGVWRWPLALMNAVAALLNVSKLFGDVLSYMRLFALGLASASLALTFNNLSAQALASNSGLALLEAGLIFVVGHLINLGLGVMSGVVHGLRLNFIEFYNWGEPGEGYAFSAFRLEEVDNE